jgi:hypothetical protein
MITKKDLRNLVGSADEKNNSVLTVYLDVDPAKAGNANRGFEATLHRLLLASKPPVHGVAEAKRFMEAAEYIQRFVSNYEPQRRTLVLVYDQADGFFWARELGVRLRDLAHWGMRPHLDPLIDAIGDFDHYGVALLADSRLRLFKVFLGEIEEYLKPVGEIIPSVERMILQEKIDHLVLVGPRKQTARLRRLMPRRLKRMTIGTAELAFEADVATVLKTVSPVIENFEFEQEQRMIRDLISTADGTSRAVTGLGRTLEFLNEGSVSNLVYTEGLRSGGYECPQCKALFSHDIERCGYCASPVSVVDNLSERILERASDNGIRIHMVPVRTAGSLARFGGVGAFLKVARMSRSK